MSVRRRNENDVAYRRPTVSTLKKVNTDQNAKDAQGRPTVRDKPAQTASKPETSESKGELAEATPNDSAYTRYQR